ncbi:uncharacterized protein LOC106674406 isoform X2 [Cimex lectularius]|uniref:Uncharacterized protein n=1 Tax=Cimex lectularius TaxID=79782 RepID=A0A8I6TLL6_CIMLE|nr:uncharacterized protein LOC106674406 isoform X2 [Cimex lectularius]
MEHYCQDKKVPCNPFDPTRVAPFKELARKSNALGVPPEQLKTKFSLPKKQSTLERKPSEQIEAKYSQGCQTIEQQNAFYFTQYVANDICRKDKECAIYSFMEYVLNATFHPKTPVVPKGKPKRKKCDHINESETCKTCEKVVDSIVQTIFKDQFGVPKIYPLAEMEQSKHVIHQPVSNKCVQIGDRRPLKSAMNRKLHSYANNFPPAHSEQRTNLYNVPKTELEHQENLLDYISKTINGLTTDHDKEKKTLDELKEENLKFMYNMKVNDELEQKMKCRSEQSRSYISQAGSKETFLTCYSCIPDSPFTNQEFNPPSTFSNYQNKIQNTMYQSTLCNECNWKLHNYIGNQSKKHYNRGSEYYDEHNGLRSAYNTNEEPKTRRICSHKSFGQHCSKHSNCTNYELNTNRMSGKKTGEQPMNSHDFTVLFRNHIDYFPQAKKQVDYSKEGSSFDSS